MRELGWALVVPVKRLATAKTRLRPGIPAGIGPARLVLAMAEDTVRAVRACPVVAEVLVVTDDPEVTAALAGAGARVVPEPPVPGLNPAVSHGAGLLGRRPVAALAADLPALRPDELARALAAAGRVAGRGFVPDAAGTGTTLLAAPPGVPLAPQFGPGSAVRHLATGAYRLAGDWPSLRRDVDTAADLAAAGRLGLGAHTRALLAEPLASGA
jgi:2-phospho-L-lactate guanylyltransferase